MPASSLRTPSSAVDGVTSNDNEPSDTLNLRVQHRAGLETTPMSDLDNATGAVLGGREPDQEELDAFSPPPSKPASRRWRKPVAVLVGLLAAAGIAGGGYLAGRDSDSDVTTTPNLSSEELVPAAPEASQTDGSSNDPTSDNAGQDGETAAGETAGDDASSDASSSDDATGAGSADEGSITDGSDEKSADGGSAATDESTETDDGEAVFDNSDGSIRWAVFSGGQLFLNGRVPSEAISTEIETKAAAIVGPDNVFNEYEIDPAVPAELSSPLFVEDVVLFEFNSVEIRRPFLPILDLGTKLLTLNPNVEIVVVGRTDAEGSEAMNLDVSEKRAQGIVDYWVRNGIDPQRLSIDARGESEATDLDDAETAALNRRAEFIISGLLDA